MHYCHQRWGIRKISNQRGSFVGMFITVTTKELSLSVIRLALKIAGL